MNETTTVAVRFRDLHDGTERAFGRPTALAEKLKAVADHPGVRLHVIADADADEAAIVRFLRSHHVQTHEIDRADTAGYDVIVDPRAVHPDDFEIPGGEEYRPGRMSPRESAGGGRRR